MEQTPPGSVVAGTVNQERLRVGETEAEWRHVVVEFVEGRKFIVSSTSIPAGETLYSAYYFTPTRTGTRLKSVSEYRVQSKQRFLLPLYAPDYRYTFNSNALQIKRSAEAEIPA